jgi:hypothetical protein
MTIKDNMIKISISENITKVKINEIIDIFSTIKALEFLEKNNVCEKAYMKIKYKENMIVTEYLNIFNVIRTPFLYDFINFFKEFKEKYSMQNNDTKVDLDDYFEEIEDISQEIVIIMLFNIQHKIEEILYIKNKIKRRYNDVP